MTKYIVSNDGKPLKMRDIALAMTFNMFGNILVSMDLVKGKRAKTAGSVEC